MPQSNMFDVATCVAAIVSALSAVAAVVAYLEFDTGHSCMHLIVENIGNGVARGIQIEGFDCSLATEELRNYLLEKIFVAHGIPLSRT